jgi:hypothetical protein
MNPTRPLQGPPPPGSPPCRRSTSTRWRHRRSPAARRIPPAPPRPRDRRRALCRGRGRLLRRPGRGVIARRDEIDALVAQQAGRAGACAARQDHAADPARRHLRTARPRRRTRPAPRSANMSMSPTPSSTSARRSSSTACSMRWPSRCGERRSRLHRRPALRAGHASRRAQSGRRLRRAGTGRRNAGPHPRHDGRRHPFPCPRPTWPMWRGSWSPPTCPTLPPRARSRSACCSATCWAKATMRASGKGLAKRWTAMMCRCWAAIQFRAKGPAATA